MNDSFTLPSLFPIKNMIAVVTGGGTGLGLACAQALCVNGARVYVLGRRLEALERACEVHGGQKEAGEMIPVQVDVRDKEGLMKAVKEIEEKEKYINLLVNAAGISGPKASPEHEDADEMHRELWENEDFEGWSDVFKTNVSGIYFCTVAFLPLLQRATKELKGVSASVVNITSMSGITKNSQGHFSYNASKAAAQHLSNMMATEFAKLRIRVNSIAPGYFPSEMTLGESDENQKSRMPAERVTKQNVPAERPGQEHEIGQALVYLCTAQYTNGQCLAVDGGYLLTHA